MSAAIGTAKSRRMSSGLTGLMPDHSWGWTWADWFNTGCR